MVNAAVAAATSTMIQDFISELALSLDSQEVLAVISKEVLDDVTRKRAVGRHDDGVCEAAEERTPINHEYIEVRSQYDSSQDSEYGNSYWCENRYDETAPDIS